MLRELNSSIGILEDAETLRRKTETELILKKHSSGLGALGAWASGGGVGKKSAEQLNAEAQAEQTAGHRDGMLWYLRKQLEACLRTQQDMMETRLSREYELSRSMLSQAGPSLADFAEFKPTSHASTDDRNSNNAPAADQGLSAEQIQMFEEGNQDMMTHFDNALDKVRYAYTSRVGMTVSNLALGVSKSHYERSQSCNRYWSRTWQLSLRILSS